MMVPGSYHRRRHPPVWPTLIAAVILILGADTAFALRPFEATDADIVSAGELELEYGALSVERDGGETGYVVPSVVLNYGLLRNLELVGEFELENAPDDDWELIDPGVFFKTILKKGVLQGQSGISLATEFGALLPATREEEEDIGASAVLLASGKLATTTYHVNLGGGVDRNGNAFWTWGVIGEIPVSKRLTLVGEVVGENPEDAEPDRSVLAGILFEPPGSRAVFDLSVRRGISDEALNWTGTLGFTISF